MCHSVKRDVNICEDLVLSHNCIKLPVILYYYNNFVTTPCCYAVSSSVVECPLKILCDANHLCVNSSSPQQIVYCSKKWSLSVLTYFSCLLWYCTPCITPWDPYEVLLVLPEVLTSREKSWHYKKKVNCLITYHRLRSVAAAICCFQEKWIQCKDFFFKGNSSSHCYSYISRCENLVVFVKYLFILYWKCSCYVGAGLL